MNTATPPRILDSILQIMNPFLGCFVIFSTEFELSITSLNNQTVLDYLFLESYLKVLGSDLVMVAFTISKFKIPFGSMSFSVLK